MKITKIATKVSELDTKRTTANIGCKICPCCRENKSTLEYVKQDFIIKGISSGGICKQWAEGIFKTRHMKIDCYKCYTCGAEWESEPYEYV